MSEYLHYGVTTGPLEHEPFDAEEKHNELIARLRQMGLRVAEKPLVVAIPREMPRLPGTDEKADLMNDVGRKL